MDKSQVDKLPGEGAVFLTVTAQAADAINSIGAAKPQGAFRIHCDIQARETLIKFAWDDVFGMEDFLFNIPGVDYDFVMDAVSISYILDEYTLDHANGSFDLSKNLKGPLRHQTAE